MNPKNSRITDFEQNFESYLNRRLSGASPLHAAMKYSLLNGGKRIRPLFVFESAELVSLSSQASEACAYALEIVHGFSLVHDDLPAMDNDDFRRGMPTTHRKFGEAQALLAGDALLTFAIQTFLESASTVAPTSFQKAFHYFTQSIAGMILGQSEELTLTDANLDQLLRIQSLKTGELFKASILCPLLLAGLSETDHLFVECEKFATGFGFAFQIADDLDDREQDRIQGVKNILSLMGHEAAIQLAKKKLLESTVARQFSATELLLAKLK